MCVSLLILTNWRYLWWTTLSNKWKQVVNVCMLYVKQQPNNFTCMTWFQLWSMHGTITGDVSLAWGTARPNNTLLESSLYKFWAILHNVGKDVFDTPQLILFLPGAEKIPKKLEYHTYQVKKYHFFYTKIVGMVYICQYFGIYLNIKKWYFPFTYLGVPIFEGAPKSCHLTIIADSVVVAIICTIGHETEVTIQD